MILSLQGCMAVGKTSAVRYIKEHCAYVNISLEDNRSVIEEIRRRGLKKDVYEDYLEIQRLWLMQEVRRWEKAGQEGCTLMDFGAEEIEFYTLNYPKSLGKDWQVEEPLQKELAAVRSCMPERILFLDASEQTLRHRKEQDTTRSREFFDYYIKHMMPLKRQWFLGRENVDVLDTDGMDAAETAAAVRAWVDRIYRGIR